MDNLSFVKDYEIFSTGTNEYQSQVKRNEDEQLKVYTFDEAISLTGHGKFHYFLLFVCGLCVLSVMAELLSISLIMELAKYELKFDIFEQGILASAGFFGIVLSSHLSGFLVDTLGRVRVLKISTACSLLCSIMSAFSWTIWIFIASRFLVGFFIASLHAGSFSYLGEFHGSKTRSKVITCLSVFISLGLVYLPAIALVVLPLNFNIQILTMNFTSWRMFIILNTTSTILVLISLQFMPESPKYLLVQGKHDETVKILKKIFSINTNRPSSEYPVTKISVDGVHLGTSLGNIKNFMDGLKLCWNQTAPLFYKPMIMGTLSIIISMIGTLGMSHGLVAWLPIMVQTQLNFEEENLTVCEGIKRSAQNTNLNATSYTEMMGDDHSMDKCPPTMNIRLYQILIVVGVSFSVIYLTFAVVLNWIRKKQLLVSWLIICGVGGIVIFWSRGIYLNIALMTLLVAVGNGGGIVSTIAVEFFPTKYNGMGMCLAIMLARLGAVASSNVIGIILYSHCEGLFYLFVSSVLIVLILTIFLPSSEGNIKM